MVHHRAHEIFSLPTIPGHSVADVAHHLRIRNDGGVGSDVLKRSIAQDEPFGASVDFHAGCLRERPVSD